MRPNVNCGRLRQLRGPKQQLSVLLLAVLVTIAVPAFAQQSIKTQDISIKAKTIAISRESNQIVATGNVRLEAANAETGTNTKVDASKMVVTIFSTPGAKNAVRGLDSIKNAEFTGPVKIVSVSPKITVDPSTKASAAVTTTTTATADRMTLNGVDGIAHLTGHVVITQDDPSMFATPAVMTGEQASVNLRGTGDFDFKIESPSGTSKIEVTPGEAPKKK